MIRPTVFVADFPRAASDPWMPHNDSSEWQPSGKGAWQGDAIEVSGPDQSSVIRVHLIGVFNALKTKVQFLSSRAVLPPISLQKGRHYGAGFHSNLGDGIESEAIGTCDSGEVLRISIDLPHETVLESVRISGVTTLYEVAFEVAKACPFSSRGAGVSLAEVGVAVRVGDRVRILRAMDQLYASAKGQPVDEARGSVLLFLAVVAAAQLEAGTRKPLHRFQLEAARALDKARTVDQVVTLAKRLGEEILGDLLEEKAPTDMLINRALNLVERNFGRHLADEDVAQQLSLSTSHFRHLFKQATGQPFHQYLISLRLEKARAMLTEQGLPVAEVARTVGFQSPAHFSRAFQKRFGVAPNAIRIGVRSSS
ncbi:MAG: helix-turn-helix transcriptional regulator [Chthonomonas sp.]|nr:helix-turn-helix transcriptional regulator [Chthonomonas sp.]